MGGNAGECGRWVVGRGESGYGKEHEVNVADIIILEFSLLTEEIFNVLSRGRHSDNFNFVFILLVTDEIYLSRV